MPARTALNGTDVTSITAAIGSAITLKIDLKLVMGFPRAD
jgi:hypothetical protein